jgi:uncharacterized SAM-binding protein YcdF (DUF218 family)
VHDLRTALSLLLGPLALVSWALLALNVLLWRQRAGRAARWLCGTTTLLLLVAACPFVANQLQRRLEDEALAERRCPPPPPGSVLVVLADGIDRSTSDTHDLLRLSDGSLRRMLAAVRLAHQVPDSVLVLSGGVGRQVREADLMRSFALAMGIPEVRLVEERGSDNTHENALYAGAVLQRMNDRPAYLVTSAMHMPRAAAVFWSADQRICPWPVDFQHREPEWADAVIPRVDSLQKTEESVREMLGYWVYRLRGHIDARKVAQARVGR